MKYLRICPTQKFTKHVFPHRTFCVEKQKLHHLLVSLFFGEALFDIDIIIHRIFTDF